MTHSPVRNLTRCALCTALLCLCSWITIPLPGISITMQTFGIFLTYFLLGGYRGTFTVFAYLLLGCAGLPVFSGFQSGFGVLLGPTGGYLWGFLVSGFVFWSIPRHPLMAAALGLLVCYGCGTIWFYFGYLSGNGSILSIMVQCVLPFLFPDTLKLWAAWSLSSRLKHLAI